MDERMHGALDGGLARERRPDPRHGSADWLTAAEAEVVAAAEAEFDAILRAIPAEPLPDLAPAVLRRIAAIEAADAGLPAARRNAPLGALIRWIWEPRRISIGWRPAYGFAAALVLALFVLIGRETAPVPAMTPMVFTQFLLDAPEARQVALAGDFTNWQPAYQLTRSEPGVWTVVVPLEPGIHNYAFIVDGDRWVPDPNAPAVDDGFGGLNSRLAVLAPDRTRS